MNQVFKGRFTANIQEPFVVFLIGMRINSIFAIRKWLPVASAMGPMVAALNKYPEKGYLGGYALVGLRGPTMVQYWRSFEELEHFARNPGDAHLAAWKRFNQAAGKEVGVWHETFQVNPGQYEAVYINMPRHGLASAAEHLPASGHMHTARGRLKGSPGAELLMVKESK